MRLDPFSHSKEFRGMRCKDCLGAQIRASSLGRLLLALTLGLATSAMALPPYFFDNFEPSHGWEPGELKQKERAVPVIQGRAFIEERVEKGSTQFLRVGPSEKGASLRVEMGPLAGAPVVYGEVLARPMALSEPLDEEFLDFDGAILAFFRMGEQGELCALFDTPEEGEGVWISTGLRFDLDAEGRMAEWLVIRIRLDRRMRRWDLYINDQPVLAGLRAVTVPDPRPASLWLYGHSEVDCEFDDVLVTPVLPDDLEAALQSNLRSSTSRRTPSTKSFPQVVRRQQSIQKLRSLAGRLPSAPVAVTTPRLHGWHLSLDTGSNVYESSANSRKNENRIVAYAPGYDEAGNRRPAVITITADSKITPGTDLSKLRWQVFELLGYPDKRGEVIGEGDFHTGLVQSFTLTPEWTRKATGVVVWVKE